MKADNYFFCPLIIGKDTKKDVNFSKRKKKTKEENSYEFESKFLQQKSPAQ